MADLPRTDRPAYDRRAFLRRAGLAGAATAALTAGMPRPAAAQDADLGPFFHGVASGDPLSDRVILWTRVTPPEDHDGDPIPVRWSVATDMEMTDVVARGESQATGQRDWTVKVDPTGLAPATTFYYAFEALGCRSVVGRTRTAPPAGASVDRLRFAVVSCANYPNGFYNAYARVADRDDLDAVFHLGDYIYETGGDAFYETGGNRGHEPPHEIVTLEDYRTRYAQYRLDPDLRRAHQVHPFIVVWDDHETTNNSHRDGAANHQPETEGDWEERKRTAARAYDEWLPIRLPDPADPVRLWRDLAFGDLLDVLMMDTRIDGRDEQVTIPGSDQEAIGSTVFFAEISDPDRQLISPEQRQWLFDGLSASQQRGTRWRLLGQQVMMMQVNAGGLPTYPDEFEGLPRLFRDGGNAVNPDAWDGYTAERDRLFAHVLDDDITNVVVITGDIHTSWAGDLTPDPYDPTTYDPTGVSPVAGRNVGVEFVTPSVTTANGDAVTGSFPQPIEDGGGEIVHAAVRADNPHIKMVDLFGHGYLVLDVTPERVQSDWYFVDTVTEPSDGESHHASFAVADGAHRVEAVDGPAASRPDAPPAPPVETAGCTAPDPTPARPTPGQEATAAPAPPLPATGGGAVLGGLAAIGGAALLRRRATSRPGGAPEREDEA